MVGEIRDLETAEIAIKAAQTGHLVLSTLHTNSAAETITRLLNMGVPAFNVASSVSLIIAQRLGRRLCRECCVPATDIPREVLYQEGFTDAMLANATIMKPVGCDACKDGYKGRVGIYEVVRITPELASLIMTGGNSLEIAKMARELGFHDLRTSALHKCAAGLISLEEVNRVTVD
jgi:type IV pilus assembly protein PilB